MRNLENRPHGFVLLGGRFIFGVFHVVGEFEELVFDVAEAGRWGFAFGGVTDGGHCGWSDGVAER